MAQTTKVTRQNRTLTVDFQDPSTYSELIRNGKAFVEWLLMDSRVLFSHERL